MQIRTRLTLLFLLIAAGILASVLIVVYLVYQNDTEETFYAGLKAQTDLTVNTLLQKKAVLQPLQNTWPAPEGDTLSYHDNVSIYNNGYDRVFTVHPEAVPVSAKAIQDVYMQGEVRFRHFNHDAFARLMEVPGAGAYIVVADAFCDLSALSRLRNILIFSFLLGIALLAGWGWYFSGQALEPVSNIMNEVDSLHPSDLSRRLHTGQNHDEMYRLAETFNRLLDRVEHAFRMQRMFLSNVSHELRNPLTAIRTQLDVVLQRERTPAAYQKALESVLEDVTSISDVEEKLLQLARIYNDPNAITFDAIRIDELLWQVKDQLLKRRPEYRVSVEFLEMPASDEPLNIHANDALLRTAIINLMDNGCKYSPDHRVWVRVRFRQDGAHEIAVCDNGPGIPREEIALIFEPFFRSPRHLQIKGTGVGLSLVQSILRLHRVGLTVNCPPAGGSVFLLQFPPKIDSSSIQTQVL
jgi:signal transduction histidine kinase